MKFENRKIILVIFKETFNSYNFRNLTYKSINVKKKNNNYFSFLPLKHLRPPIIRASGDVCVSAPTGLWCRRWPRGIPHWRPPCTLSAGDGTP